MPTSGPIVRTGATPEFWNNWDNVFGGKKKSSAAKTSADKPAKAASKKTASASTKKKVAAKGKKTTKRK